MVNMDIPRPSSAPIFGPLPPLQRSGAYAPSLDSSERRRATLLDDIEMLAGVRNQQHHGSSNIPGDATVASSSHSSATLNASSTGEQEEVRARLPILDGVRRLARLLRHPFSGSTNQDRIRLNKKWGYDDIRYEKLDEDFVHGIPRLAKLHDSDDSFRIIRRFGPITFRLLLRKMMEIIKLQEQLHRLDKKNDANESLNHRLHSVEDVESDPEKAEVLHELDLKIPVYYDLVLKYTSIQGLADVPLRDQRSVQNWIVAKRPLSEGQDAYIKVLEDLAFAKVGRSGSTQYGNIIEDMLESLRAWSPNGWFNVYTRDLNRDRNTADDLVDYTSSRTREVLGRAAFALLAIIVVLVPVFLMFLIDVDRVGMASIVTGSIVVFMILIAAAADVPEHELFLCVVGYSAILVAILGSKMSQGGSGA